MLPTKTSLRVLPLGLVVLTACQRDDAVDLGLERLRIPELPEFDIPGSNPPPNIFAPPDGGTERPDDGTMTLRVVNLSDAPLNACCQWAPESGAMGTQMGPVFRAAGIPPLSQSERVTVDRARIRVTFIPVGAACELAGAETRLVDPTETTTHLGVWFAPGTNATVPNASAFDENVAAIAGKESVRLAGHDTASASLSFAPQGGGPSLSGPSFEVEGGALGSLVVTADLQDVARPIRAKSGGTLSVFFAGGQVVLCDDSAPVVDGVSSCGPEVRQP